MPLVCPWRQGTTDRDVTTRLKFSQPERIRDEQDTAIEPRHLPYRPPYRHHLWFGDIRSRVKLEGRWIYSNQCC